MSQKKIIIRRVFELCPSDMDITNKKVGKKLKKTRTLYKEVISKQLGIDTTKGHFSERNTEIIQKSNNNKILVAYTFVVNPESKIASETTIATLAINQKAYNASLQKYNRLKGKIKNLVDALHNKKPSNVDELKEKIKTYKKEAKILRKNLNTM